MAKDRQRISSEKHEIAYCRKIANHIIKSTIAVVGYNQKEKNRFVFVNIKPTQRLARAFLKFTSKKKLTRYKNVRRK